MAFFKKRPEPRKSTWVPPAAHIAGTSNILRVRGDGMRSSPLGSGFAVVFTRQGYPITTNARKTDKLDPNKTDVFDPNKTDVFDPNKTDVFDQRKTALVNAGNSAVINPRKTTPINTGNPPAFDPRKTIMLKAGNFAVPNQHNDPFDPRKTVRFDLRKTTRFDPRKTTRVDAGDPAALDLRKTMLFDVDKAVAPSVPGHGVGTNGRDFEPAESVLWNVNDGHILYPESVGNFAKWHTSTYSPSLLHAPFFLKNSLRDGSHPAHLEWFTVESIRPQDSVGIITNHLNSIGTPGSVTATLVPGTRTLREDAARKAFMRFKEDLLTRQAGGNLRVRSWEHLNEGRGFDYVAVTGRSGQIVAVKPELPAGQRPLARQRRPSATQRGGFLGALKRMIGW